MRYPRYSELTEAQKGQVNNGCGPSWTPKLIKSILFTWMFTAQCGHHDWGYLVGGDERRRIYCDLKFGGAMLTDIVRHLARGLIGLLVAPFFFTLVLVFGWAFFHYGTPRSVPEALSRVRKKE